jgi:predicted DNA-binding transcriptional regulator YafY
MEAAVRQREIMFLLLSSSEPLSLTELSHRYAVSARTIQRDIDALTPLVPIHIKQGRCGGVFLLPTKLMTMANMQITTLNKVLQDANHCICELTPDQIEILEHLIDYITNYVMRKTDSR